MNSLYVAVCVFMLAASTQAVNLGADCQNDAECTETAENSHCWFQYDGCSHGTCLCTDNYYEYSATECRLILNLGDPCTENNQGNIDCLSGTTHSVCEGEVCACPAAMPEDMEVNGVHYCYHAAYGGECNGPDQCLTYSTSTMGTCTADDTCGCIVTAMQDDANENVCRLATRTEACTTNQQGVNCNPGLGLECINDVCECPEGWEWTDGTCMHTSRNTVGVDQECDVNRIEEGANVCESDLVCGKCPEDAVNAPTVCLSTGGASSLTATITLLASTGFVALRMLF